MVRSSTLLLEFLLLSEPQSLTLGFGEVLRLPILDTWYELHGIVSCASLGCLQGNAYR